MICLLSGPDLLVNFIIFSKPTILQVRCRDPISILRNLCPWHSALFAVVVLFDCSNSTFSSCMYAILVTVCCACCVSQKYVQLFIKNSLFDLSGAHLYFQSQWNGLLMFVIYMIRMSWIWWFWCLWNKWKFDILFAVGDLEWADWWVGFDGLFICQQDSINYWYIFPSSVNLIKS